jgi:hypothetical protein
MAMISDAQIRTDYSPIVSMRLEANGKVWPIAKLGPDHFVPIDRGEIPAGRGQIIMTVDGQERRWNVRIPNDVFPFDNEVKILHE